MNWLRRLLGHPIADPQPVQPRASVPPASTAAATTSTAAKPSTIARETPPPFPYPLVTVSGAEAVATWRKLQAEWRKEGCSAVVLGDLDDLRMRADMMAGDPGEIAQTIALGERLSSAEFFKQRAEEYAPDGLERLAGGPWPEGAVPPPRLTAHLHPGTSRPKALVHIARIPTPRAWEVSAYLKAGGWNDCPDPVGQVAALKYWHGRYGIEVYSLTGDVTECLVARPPATRDEALSLAREQYLFCQDIVEQGTESIVVLAATLQNSEVWYFWWD